MTPKALTTAGKLFLSLHSYVAAMQYMAERRYKIAIKTVILCGGDAANPYFRFSAGLR